MRLQWSNYAWSNHVQVMPVRFVADLEDHPFDAIYTVPGLGSIDVPQLSQQPALE